MAETEAPKQAPSPLHAGTFTAGAGAVLFAGLRYVYPDLPEPPAELVMGATVILSFVGGIVAKALRQRGLI